MTLVKNLIAKKSETKFVSHAVETNIVHNSRITGGDIVPIIPAISQGTDDWNRLGDSIKPLSLTVKGLLSMYRLASPGQNRVLMVRVMILASKSVRSNNNIPGALNTGALLKPNYASGVQTQGFDGNQLDLYAPVNTDQYRVYYDKIHKICPIAPDSSVEENPASVKRWSAKVSLPSTLLYDIDSTGGQEVPTNFAPFLCMGYAFADGTGPDLVQTRLISSTFATLKFKDF